jgi:hypothetical protein
MATYLELKSLFGNGPLRDKMEVALCDKARAILAEATPNAGRLAWVETVLSNTAAEAERVLKYVLAANKGLTTTQIMAAIDATLQTQVDTAIDKLHP